MTAEEFMKIHKVEYFVCQKYRNPCRISIRECVKRQDAANRTNGPTPGMTSKWGGMHGTQYDYTNCLDCSQGRRNRAKLAKMSKKGKK